MGHLRRRSSDQDRLHGAFKLLTPDTLKVIIFDDDGIEVVNKCGKHDEAIATKD